MLAPWGDGTISGTIGETGKLSHNFFTLVIYKD